MLRERVWFQRWITEGYSVRQLSLQSGHGPVMLRQCLHHWLKCEPTVRQGNLDDCQRLLMDGTFVHRPFALIALMNAADNKIISGQYGVNERSPEQLHVFLTILLDRGLCPSSCTLDGTPQMIRALKRVWPNITIQRCVVHIQRQGISWCRLNPKRTDALKLRNIFLSVTNIRDHSDRIRFIETLEEWEYNYGAKIKEAPAKGWVFSDLQRARSMLVKALPSMFHYLDDPGIPASTNALEGYFSRLKADYRGHRGLSPNNRFDYFKWYFHLKPR